MFSEKLRKYREKLALSREGLAHRVRSVHGVNCTKENITSWEGGANPKIDAIIALADVLGIPEQYLFNDSSEAIDTVIGEKMPMVKGMVENVLRVDMVNGYVGAGSVGNFIDINSIREVIYVDKVLIDKRHHNSRLESLVVVGDSMVPYVNAGDVVIFCVTAPGTKTIDGKYVIETSAGVMVKNLSFKCNGDIVISSCNRIYESEIIKANESQEYLEIIGMVVGRVLKS